MKSILSLVAVLALLSSGVANAASVTGCSGDYVSSSSQDQFLVCYYCGMYTLPVYSTQYKLQIENDCTLSDGGSCTITYEEDWNPIMQNTTGGPSPNEYIDWVQFNNSIQDGCQDYGL